MPKLKINTYGEGIEIRQLNLDAKRYQDWTAIAAKTNRSLIDLVLDPFFYYRLKDKEIKELPDIDANLMSGMLNTPKSQIEIWCNRRKVLKIPSNDLFNEMLLFPLFNIEKNESFLSAELSSGLYVVQRTIGLLSSQQVEVANDNLSIDDLAFSIATFEANQFCADIKYHNQKLNFVKSETIITYQTAFEIK